MYNNTGCQYSDMGTEYGHLRYLLNKKCNKMLISYNHIILIYCNFLIQIMSHKMLRPFIVKVSVLGYFLLIHLHFYITRPVVGPEFPCYNVL